MSSEEEISDLQRAKELLYKASESVAMDAKACAAQGHQRKAAQLLELFNEIQEFLRKPPQIEEGSHDKADTG